MAIAGQSLDIIWPRLISITDEVATTLIRSAFSHDVVEVHDMSVGVFDEQGRMLAQTPLGATGHTMPMSAVMKVVLEQVDREDIRPGDVFIANDPHAAGGTHLPDVNLAQPVFVEGEILGFVCNIAHHADIGGMAPGSMAGGMSEIYQEGLRIPVIRLFREGVLQQDLLDLLLLLSDGFVCVR